MSPNRSIGMVALFFGFAGTMLMAEEKRNAILAAAKKLSHKQPWHVKRTFCPQTRPEHSGIINGKDFDLTILRYVLVPVEKKRSLCAFPGAGTMCMLVKGPTLLVLLRALN